jgi:hypothetical protein
MVVQRTEEFLVELHHTRECFWKVKCKGCSNRTNKDYTYETWSHKMKERNKNADLAAIVNTVERRLSERRLSERPVNRTAVTVDAPIHLYRLVSRFHLQLCQSCAVHSSDKCSEHIHKHRKRFFIFIYVHKLLMSDYANKLFLWTHIHICLSISSDNRPSTVIQSLHHLWAELKKFTA